MMKKWLISLSLLIFTVLLFAFPVDTVRASHTIWWWEKPHRAVIMYPTKINHIVMNGKHPMGHKAGSKYLKAGQLVWIRKIDTMGTVVTWKGKAFSHYNYWASYNYSNDWFDLYQKNILIDIGLFKGATHRLEKSYKFTWPQYCKLVKMGLWTAYDKAQQHRINQQVKKWNISKV